MPDHEMPLELVDLTVVAGVALLLCGGFRRQPARVKAEGG